MTPWEAVILGTVQGATEFLPVSSSGHLVIGQALLGLELPGVVFEVTVHVATLLSILMAYRTRVRTLVMGVIRGEAEAWRYLGLIVVATIPAGLVGVGLRHPVEALFEAPAVTGVALLITGALLWSTRAALARGVGARPGLLAAIVMGLTQAVAIVPGISRSGATVVAGLWLGVGTREAAEFGFLMAVPAIAGAAVLQLPDLAARGTPGLTMSLALGGLAAAATGIVAIWTFVAMLQRRSFHQFGVYCWLLGAGFLAYLAVT